MDLIRQNSHLFNNPTNEMGYGIPDFEEAYHALQILGTEDQMLKETFAIYPNPVTDVFNVSFPQQLERAVVIIYDVLGKQVLEKEISAVENKVNISELSGGVYIASIAAEGVINNFKRTGSGAYAEK